MNPFRVFSKRKLTMLAAACMLTAGSITASQEGMEDLDLSALLNITLETGSFLELDLRKSPVTMTVIDAKKIEVSGAQNLNDLLETYVPGFQYMINKWNGTIWGMRGVTGDRNDKIIVLVNGRKQNMQAFHGFATEYSLGILGDINRVEVLRGPAGLVYGSGAIAGVVNIVTQEADGDNNSKASVSVQGNQGDIHGVTAEGSVFGEGDEGQKFSAHIGYHKSNGLGDNAAKVFGHYEMNNGVTEGADGRYTAGSPGETPGNWLASADFSWKGFRAYARMTHQVQPLASYFYPAPFSSDDDSGASVWIKDQQYIKDVTNNYHIGWLPHPRTHVRSNMMIDLSYDLAVGDDKVIFDAGIIGNSNKLVNAEDVNREEGLVYTNGEKRYELGAKYMLKRFDAVQVAAGFQFGSYNLGGDMEGYNLFWSGDRPWITDVTYNNFALFAEGYHTINDFIGYDLGIRFDKHTRTEGVASPKAALVVTPNEKNTFKFIVQSSSNNADVLAYEFSGPADIDEKPWTYENATLVTQAAGDSIMADAIANGNDPYTALEAQLGQLQAPKNKDLLQELKPEKSLSFELTGAHQIGESWNVGYSGSFNRLTELFLWNSAYQQTVNLGEYDAVSIEAEGAYDNDVISAGANVAIQFPVNIDNSPTTFTRPDFNPVWGGADGWIPQATTNPAIVTSADILAPQISSDEENFNSLHKVTSKLYFDYSPVSFLTAHLDARMFWGLKGREKIHADNGLAGDKISGILDGSSIGDRIPMTKLNASLLFNLPKDFKVGVFAYNLLGEADNAHSVRWQQMAAYSQSGYYTVDQRSFALKLTKGF